MKKVFNNVKNNIFICDLIFVSINIVINFVLYLMNIRFRLWFIILILLISIVGFIVGIFQLIYKYSDNKIKAIFISLLGFVPIVILFFLFMPIIGFVIIFSYKPEHTTTLDNKKYVAVVSSFLNVDVDYYDYYGFLLMGTKVKVHGDFGKGGYDPFTNPNVSDGVEYTYYDDKGKVKSKRTETFIKDKDGKVIDKNNYNIDIDKNNDFDDSDNYVLPENEEVLYERKFNKTILRFVKVDNVLDQNMLVHVLRSKDNGKNFYVVSDDVIQVSNEAKFVFLNENLGFAISTGKIYLDNSKAGLYTTNDSGKTFISAKFNYSNDNVDYISIEEVPYYDNDTLKIKCSVYQINSNKDGYEDKELIFISNDNGLNWNLESN